MTVLDNTQRQTAWANIMAQWSARNEEVALLSGELRTNLDAVDQWVSDNQTSFNQALTVTARASLTAGQKAELLLFVVKRRFIEGV